MPDAIGFHEALVIRGGIDAARGMLDNADLNAPAYGQDPQLFVVGQNYGGPEQAQPSGRVVAFPAPAPGAGKP